MQLIHAVAIAIATTATAGVLACSSGTTFGFAGGGSSGGVDSEGSGVPPDGIGKKPSAPPAPGSAPCPTSIPPAGGSCFMQVCEYGGNADPSCNVVARCDDNYGWRIEQPEHCPASCPERFDERVPGATCSDPDVCTYLEATCGCAGAIIPPPPPPTSDGGADDAGDDGATDAAADAETGPPKIGHWQCVRPGNGCPARRPQLGTKCLKAMTCDYGTCVFGVPLTYECLQGTWNLPSSEQAQVCP